MRLPAIVLALLITLALAFSPTANAGKGKLGFSVDASTTGIINPTLKMVRIKTVTPGSPAAVAGLKPGDHIIELDGLAVEGAPAKAVYGRLRNLQAGEHVRLELRRSGKPMTVEIVAGG